MEKKLIKLGNATNFWDPTQTEVENQKLVGNQVKLLEYNTQVKSRVNAGALEVATEEDLAAYKEFMKKENEFFSKAKTATATKKSEISKLKIQISDLYTEKESSESKLSALRTKVEEESKKLESANDQEKKAIQKSIDSLNNDILKGQEIVNSIDEKLASAEEKLEELSK